MRLFNIFKKYLSETLPKDIDYDSSELIEIQRKILNEKRMLRDVFSEFYDKCIELDIKYFRGSGKRVEIGAGASFFKKKYPEVISSDIKNADNLDIIINAMDMDFESQSIRAIYCINCFHHFSDPHLFFKELNRVLVKGGGCILIEPYYGFISSQLYKKLFDTEIFDKTQKEWINTDSSYMIGANQALSYIVFKRDVKEFNQLYPELEIVYANPLNNYIRYLVSGGFYFRPLLPYYFSPLLKNIESFIMPFNKILALHHIIVIRKKHRQEMKNDNL